jgi:TIR domain
MQSEPLTSFLSYPRENWTDSETVFRFMRSMGVECWWDQESLVGGEDWDRSRSDAQNAADLFLLICSEHTFNKDGVIQREIREALERAKDKRPGKIYIVPLLAQEIELPKEIGKFQWIALYQQNWRGELARTLKAAMQQKGLPVSPSLEVASATTLSKDTVPIIVDESNSDGPRYLEYFNYAVKGEYWEFVNSTISALALGELYEARRQMADWTHQTGTGDWYLSVTEFHRSGELVSLIVGGSSYFSGAAHPNHSLRTINLFGSNCGRVTIGEMFDYSDAAYQILLENSLSELKQQGALDEEKGPQSSYFVEIGWELFGQFNVNDKGLVLNLSTSSGLAHAFGQLDVYVSWAGLVEFLVPSIKTFLIGSGTLNGSEYS